MSSNCAASSTEAGTAWFDDYAAIWHCDFEFVEDANHHPVPVCMFAHEQHTGRLIQMWRHELLASRQAPFETGPESLFVAYAANAELSCFLALGWQFPKNVLDVYVETIAAINGNDIIWMEDKRPKLPEALQLFGMMPTIDVKEKQRMIGVILDNYPNYTPEQQYEIQNYNRIDVVETVQLLEALAPTIDVPRALLRGRYMAAVARMERCGLPVDVDYLRSLLAEWERLRLHYIQRDDTFGLYDGTSFNEGRWRELIVAKGWDGGWPRTKSGQFEKTLKALGRQARRYPELRPLVRLRTQIAELRINQFANTVGADCFSRCPLLPFWTRTGRNQPSAGDKMFLPGLPGWLHGVIAPPPGWAVADLDWDGQENAIAAAYFNDARMIEDYQSGDPHIGFGRRVRLVPPDATKNTSPEIKAFRDKILKPLVHGQNYGMTPYGIRAKTGKSLLWSRGIYAQHRLTYPDFHRNLANAVAQAKFDGRIETPYGWGQAVTAQTTNRNLMNFRCRRAPGTRCGLPPSRQPRQASACAVQCTTRSGSWLRCLKSTTR
jgi:DNA polymerase-1